MQSPRVDTVPEAPTQAAAEPAPQPQAEASQPASQRSDGPQPAAQEAISQPKELVSQPARVPVPAPEAAPVVHNHADIHRTFQAMEQKHQEAIWAAEREQAAAGAAPAQAAPAQAAPAPVEGSASLVEVEAGEGAKVADAGEEPVDMTASMIRRITTAEEAKAALAERRRQAREQAEREAELERQRLVSNASLPFKGCVLVGWNVAYRQCSAWSDGSVP